MIFAREIAHSAGSQIKGFYSMVTRCFGCCCVLLFFSFQVCGQTGFHSYRLIHSELTVKNYIVEYIQ